MQDIGLGIYVSVLAVLFIEIIKETKMIFEYSSLEGKWEEFQFLIDRKDEKEENGRINKKEIKFRDKGFIIRVITENKVK